MKKANLLFAIMITASVAVGQSVGINANGDSPSASAMLDVSSTSKGFLVPRMTKTQRDAISSPAEGLMIYQTSTPAGFYIYNGSAWVALGAGDDTYYPNLFIGERAGDGDSNSQENTGIGTHTLYANQEGNGNTAIGFYALSENTGYGNTAVGSYALYYNTDGLFNTTIGGLANQSMTGYSGTVAIGYDTETSGNGSTAIGYSTEILAGGHYSIAIGYNSEINGGENSIVIGNSITTSNSNEIILGNSSNNKLICKAACNGINNAENFYINSNGEIGRLTSSRRYKTNIRDMEDVSWLYDLKPVNFTYKTDSLNIKQYGLIAEEVLEVNPDFVFFKDGQVEGVSYSKLIVPIIKIVQGQNNTIKKLQKEIELLKKQNKDLRQNNTTIDELKAEIESIKKTLTYQKNRTEDN